MRLIEGLEAIGIEPGFYKSPGGCDALENANCSERLKAVLGNLVKR